MRDSVLVLQEHVHVLLEQAGQILSEPTYFFAPGPDPRVHVGELVRAWLDERWLHRCVRCRGCAGVFALPLGAGGRERSICFDCRHVWEHESTGRIPPSRTTGSFAPLEWMRTNLVLGVPPLGCLVELLQGRPGRVWAHRPGDARAFCIEWSTRTLSAPLLLGGSSTEPTLRLRAREGLIEDASSRKPQFCWNGRRLETPGGAAVFHVKRRVAARHPLQLVEPRGPTRFVLEADRVLGPSGEVLFAFDEEVPPVFAAVLAARHQASGAQG